MRKSRHATGPDIYVIQKQPVPVDVIPIKVSKACEYSDNITHYPAYIYCVPFVYI